MELQVGVKILLKNREGKYLLARRNPKKYPDVGAKWDIIGGRIIPGTPLLDNLKREIKEEVNLDYTGRPKLVAAQDLLKVADRHVVRLTYVGGIEGEPSITDDDHLEAKWFSAEEVLKLDPLDSFFKELLDTGVIII